MKDIKVLLLQGGVEVIAEVEEIKGVVLQGYGEPQIEGYRLNKPLRLLPVPLPMQTPQGIAINIAPQLIPLVGMTIQQFIEVDIDDIVGKPMDANAQFTSIYIKQTTGLQLASSLAV